MNNIATKSVQRRRAPQQRAEETRAALLETAVHMFTTHSYDGISIRALETAANVQRGAAAYHFESKEGLWKAAVGTILERFVTRLGTLETVLIDLDEDEQIRAEVKAFVRFSAETPELNRLIIQEGREDTWRLDYLVNTFIRDRFGRLRETLNLLSNPHTYYMAIGAATLVFDVEYECKTLFGVDPKTDEFIRDHAARVADMVVYLRRKELAEEETR
ncbi:MAG: TetR/AcrR family transcriptional regulator [Candidatus Phaeomarinobacter sp.]